MKYTTILYRLHTCEVLATEEMNWSVSTVEETEVYKQNIDCAFIVIMLRPLLIARVLTQGLSYAGVVSLFGFTLHTFTASYVTQ